MLFEDQTHVDETFVRVGLSIKLLLIHLLILLSFSELMLQWCIIAACDLVFGFSIFVLDSLGTDLVLISSYMSIGWEVMVFLCGNHV